jgi:hypothetical protein
MIVWGGHGGSDLNTGGRYDPSGDEWAATTTTGAPVARYNHTGVWTGTELIVFGGWSGSWMINSGGRYDPDTDSWTATSISGAPAIRHLHVAVWTGDEMIVWGGAGSASAINTGGLYDPDTDSWTATSTSGAPSGRYYFPAVWTGTEMIVWGGYNSYSNLGDGGRYDPVTNTWAAVSNSLAPQARRIHGMVWTGTEVIVWGGSTGSGVYTDTGGRYEPSTDTWTATSTLGAPAGRNQRSAVWADSAQEAIFWGEGGSNSGGRFCASGVTDFTDPTDPTIDGTDPLTSTWTTDTTVEVEWSGATDDDVGVAGYSVLFDQVSDTSPDDVIEVSHTTDPHSFESAPLADGGSHYFHLATCDTVGNCTSTVHAGPFWIDTTAPSAPGAVTSSSHDGGASADTTIDVAWLAASDATSLVDGYSYTFDGNASWSCETTKDVEEGVTSAVSSTLGVGAWYFHVCAVDHAGHWGPVTTGGPYVIELTPPTVTGVQSISGTADGFLTEDEVVATPVTQVRLAFSEDMENPGGSGTPGDVSNPASYLLVHGGSDGIVQSACGSVDPSDMAITVNSIYYESFQDTANLYLNNGVSLPRGNYELFACATLGLSDDAGNLLDGNGDGTGGDDFGLSFSILATDILSNPNADVNETGWTYDGPGTVSLYQTGADSDGMDTSGSLELFGTGTAQDLMLMEQCVAIPESGYYQAGGRVDIDEGSPDSPVIVVELTFFDLAGCTPGDEIATGQSQAVAGDTGDVWVDLETVTVEAPGSASSALVTYALSPSQSTNVRARYDALYLWIHPFLVFQDGFEGGDTLGWSGAVPSP